MAKVDYFFENKEAIQSLSKEIGERFINDANDENVDYSFDIAKGTGKLKTKTPNTSFYFDTNKGSTLDSLKKALFDEDLVSIEQDTPEEKVLMEKVRELLKQVSEEINFNYITEIRDTIRRVILPGSKEEDIPLHEITIISIDIADFSGFSDASKYMLKIGKNPDASIQTDKVTMFIQDRQEETGKTVDEIFEEEKLANPMFQDIISVERGRKYLYDINVTLFIDYSLSSLPPKLSPK